MVKALGSLPSTQMVQTLRMAVADNLGCYQYSGHHILQVSGRWRTKAKSAAPENAHEACDSSPQASAFSQEAEWQDHQTKNLASFSHTNSPGIGVIPLVTDTMIEDRDLYLNLLTSGECA